MWMLARLGQGVLSLGAELHYHAALLGTAAVLAVRPRSWPRTVREVLGRQIRFTGVEAVPFVVAVALLVGVSTVVQARFWLASVGQSHLLGAVVASVLVGELTPLLVNIVVIGRSVSAMTAELATMKAAGEVHTLDAMGIDPFVYLVLPRIAGMAVSVLSLAVVFFLVAVGGGHLASVILLRQDAGWFVFADSVLAGLTPTLWAALLAKLLVPALLTGMISCSEGLAVSTAITDVPIATRRALARSVAVLLAVCGLLSVAYYS